MRCPECGNELEDEEDELAVLCEECYAKREEAILKWEKQFERGGRRMNPNTTALLKIAAAVGEILPHQEISNQTILNVLETLKNVLNITRCTFWQIHDQSQECEIIAGLPSEEHGNDIGKKYLLKEHPDISFIIGSLGEFSLISDPYENKLTRYFHDLIEGKQINAIGYSRVSYSPQFKDGNKGRKITGILVVDASGEKITLNLDEQNLCRTVAKLIASRLVSFEDFLLVLYNEWEDAIRNPATAIGGWTRRLEKVLENEKNPKIKEYLGRIIQEVKKMEMNI